jgi:CHAD domain-containing protein
VKKCRYVLETLARLKLAPRGTRLRPLRRIQSALGRAHDLEVLRQYARRRMPLLQREERGWVTRALRLSRAAFRER